MMSAMVTAVSSNGEYSFTKPNRDSITLLAGLGVEGDVHAGVTVKHRSRVAQDPTQPNLRQVHLIHAELHDELGERGFTVAAGDDHGHDAGLAHQVALGVTVEHGGHEPGLQLLELYARVAQPGHLHHSRVAETESGAGGEAQEVDAAGGHVLAHVAG